MGDEFDLFKDKNEIFDKAFRYPESDDEDDEAIEAERSKLSEVDSSINSFKQQQTTDKSYIQEEEIEPCELSLEARGDSIYIRKITPQKNQIAPSQMCIELGDSDEEYTPTPAVETQTQDTSRRETRLQSRLKEVIIIDEDHDDDDDEVVDITPNKHRIQFSQPQNNRPQQTPNQSNNTPNQLNKTPDQILSNQNSSIEDRDFTLRIYLLGILKQYQTTYRTSLADALKPLLDDLGTRGKTLKLSLKGETLSLEGSPLDLKLRPGDFLHAVEKPIGDALVEKEEQQKMDVEREDENDPDVLIITLQDGIKKHTRKFKISKGELLIRLKSDYAKEFNLDSTENIKLMFDGDEVCDDATAESLELDDEETIDVLVS